MKTISIIVFLATALTASAQQAQLQAQAQRQANRQLNRQVLNNANQNINTNQNTNTNTNRNANVNRNRTQSNATSGAISGSTATAPTSISVTDNSVQMAPTIPSFTMSVDYLAWKASRKTKKGAQPSPFDTRSARPVTEYVAPKDSKAKYDAFLRSKGISPNTLGHATLVSGKMVVPSIEEQYASQNSNYAQMLAAAK